MCVFFVCCVWLQVTGYQSRKLMSPHTQLLPHKKSAALLSHLKHLTPPLPPINTLSPYRADQIIPESLPVLSKNRGQVGLAFQTEPDPKFILFQGVRESITRQ